MSSQYFFYLLKPITTPMTSITMNKYLDSLSDDQKQTVFKHFAYMEELETTNKILVGGPLLDAQGLVLILQVESEAEAIELVSKDPTIVNKLFKIAESHPMQIAVSGWKHSVIS